MLLTWLTMCCVYGIFKVETIALIMADDESEDWGVASEAPHVTLVVAPMSLLAQWCSEIFRHTTLKDHEVSFSYNLWVSRFKQ